MKKLGLLLSATGAMVIAASGVAASHLTALPERDARIIVEVNRNINELTEQGARVTQDAVYNNIKQYATTNVKRVKSYHVLNNAFLLEVNSEDIESIKAVPGVASVTVDKAHWVQTINNDEYEMISTRNTDPAIEEQNISASTMLKPDATNDGEGTIIAILDNEFHLRGKTAEAAAWNHEVFNALDSDVAVRYTYESIKSITGLNAGARASGAEAGDEGSMYFNNKVPFYYDYGGTNTVYGKRGEKQFDVHSELSYHGSHVSSITAANAPTYKGIAPKAQLALMKVFTDYDAKGLGEKIGLSNSTGAYDSSILEALEDCILLKVDGINMSLGSDLDDFDGDSITLKTLTRLHNAGILSSISAGNSGKASYASTGSYANWGVESVETGIMSSYANNAASMTIASGQPTQIFYENAFNVNGENVAFEDQIVNRPGMEEDYNVEFRMADTFTGGVSVPWVYVPGFGTSADYNGLNVEGKVAVVNRGSTSFANKYEVAANKGAAALVIINNDPTASDFNFRCSFGDGFNPTMPCALVLYKNKALFEGLRQGSFTLINKQVSDNPNKYTVSTFSTDGATFDLDLKPEITAPGDNIKGAVPEHAMTSLTAAEREAVKYKAYQYLSGTSMSAPNYAGAQAVVLSKVTKDIVTAQNARQAAENAAAESESRAAEVVAFTNAEQTAMDNYRQTVDMRLMSTANPMKDLVASPEGVVDDNNDGKYIASPRVQGAGMVDLNGALSTDVYLEGYDLGAGLSSTKTLGKSKIVLRNNSDIANGNIRFKFLAHNESSENRTYYASLTVMRPAIAHPNDLVTKDYTYKGEIDSIEALTGMKYYDDDLDQVMTATGTPAFKDAVKITKDVDYFASKEDYQNNNKTTIKSGYYYNSAKEGVNWEPLPSYTAQSVRDTEIANVDLGMITIEPGDQIVKFDDAYRLTEEQKKTILDTFEFGCMIEGYLTLTSADAHADLSMPYLGFYSGSDKDESASYESAPVTEPFNFEKDITKVYPSDYVNDITKALIGKDKVNFESMIVAGYAENPQKIDIDKVLTNDQSFDKMTGFYKVGTNPLNNEYTDNPSNDIYVGSKATNTMIIQQFILRSVAENNFSITNKETHEVVYKSALEDMLFSDTAGKWALYKSHVDAGYLSAGYVAHRAYAIVPLYDERTGVAFPSGEYELQFNYQLAATKNWVSKSYTIHIDSADPVVTSITGYREDGVDRIRAYIKDDKLSYGVIGYNRVDAHYDEENKLYYLDETLEFVKNSIEEISEGLDSKRLYISAVDYARGRIGCVAHLNNVENLAEGFETVQGSGIEAFHDFTYENDKLSFINVNTGAQVEVSGKVIYNGFAATETNPGKKGCKSSLVTASLIVCIPSLMGATLLILKKKKGDK